ncbi:hypothetical protein ACQY0O_007954 [Thecaphora frezii]
MRFKTYAVREPTLASGLVGPDPFVNDAYDDDNFRSLRPNGKPLLDVSEVRDQYGLVIGIEYQEHRLSLVALNTADRLSIVGVHHVVFDHDLPEYRTFTRIAQHSSALSHNLRASLVISALDLLLERCAEDPSIDLARVRAIGCCGVTCTPVLLRGSANACLWHLSPRQSLFRQLTSLDFFACESPDEGAATSDESPDLAPPQRPQAGVANTMSTSAAPPARALPLFNTFAAELVKLSSGAEHDRSAWQRTAHITSVTGLIISLLAGRLHRFDRTSAAATGLADLSTLQHRVPRWNEDLLAAIGIYASRQLPEKLGPIDSDLGPRWQSVSPWLVQRFGFDADCLVAPCLPAEVASFLSFNPDPDSVGLGTSATSDHLVVPLDRLPTRLPSSERLPTPYHFVPCPVEGSRWLAVFELESACEARTIARDGSANGRWAPFRQVVNAVPFGATPSLDDKCFAVFVPSGRNRGLRRFEGGQEVRVFSDVRADPLVVLEGQALALRIAIDSIAQTCAASHRKLGLEDDCVRDGARPSRIFGWGKAASDPCIASVFGKVFGAPVIVGRGDATRAEEAAASGESVRSANATAKHVHIDRPSHGGDSGQPAPRRARGPRRAMLGAAMHAFYALETRLSYRPAPFSMVMSAAFRHRSDTDATSSSTTPSWRASPPGSFESDNDDDEGTWAAQGSSPSSRSLGRTDPWATAANLVQRLQRERRQLQKDWEASQRAWARELDERGLVEVAAGDADMFDVYGALAAEYRRLATLAASVRRA